ncbi:MAG: hypothetical protein M3Z09_01585 [Acidobacteriota bacterium]|nr:hypothetical protein [Acidobacteriota bacterium]
MEICSGTAPYITAQPCWEQKVIASNFSSLLTAYTAKQTYPYDTAVFPMYAVELKGTDTSGANLLRLSINGGRTQYDIAWWIVFDPNTISNSDGCVGGGNPGCIVAAEPVWRAQAGRYCGLKGSNPSAPGWAIGSTKYIGNQQFTANVVNGGADGAANSVGANPATFISCPANSYGITGNHCIKVTVGSEPLAAGFVPAGNCGGIAHYSGSRRFDQRWFLN